MVKLYRKDELKWLFMKHRLLRPFRITRAFISNIFWPHNVIKIKALPRSWVDKDEVMFHAMFQILCNFIEKEHPFDNILLEEHPRTIEEMHRLLSKRENQAKLEDEDVRKQFLKSYRIDRTVLDLYCWYINVGQKHYHTLSTDEIDEKLSMLVEVRRFLFV